jgi:Fic family protein
MKIPVTPPSIDELFTLTLGGPTPLTEVISKAGGPAPSGRYRHWDTLRHVEPPRGLTNEEWWLGVKLARQNIYQELPLVDKAKRPFKYALPGIALQMLQLIDRDASGNLEGNPQVTDPQTRDTYLFRTLVEEAITSSQLEGASTTRRVAKEMIQTGRPPRDKSEQMIFNNYEAMLYVRRLFRERLTPGHVIELQRILTHGAIDDLNASGRLRLPTDEIHVADDVTGEPLHIPPNAKELAKRLHDLCDFANGDTPADYVHPVVRSVILHFWLGYDHPFVDGNGRTARALFYWSMARQGYWLCEFISISRILKASRSDYSRAFLYTETDDNDATYFLLHQLRVLHRGIDELHTYLKRKAAELQETTRALASHGSLGRLLNYRQLALLNHAMKDPDAQYTIQSHGRSHRISYATSRSDLLTLARKKLLELKRVGKRFEFAVPSDLNQRMSAQPREN